MIAPIPSFDAVSRCASEIWRSLEATVRMTLEYWKGSDIDRRALERVLAVMTDRLERVNKQRGDATWTN